MALLVLGGLGLGLAAMTTRAVWQQRNEAYPNRWLPFGCECGKVTGRARLPFVHAPSVVCNCEDCAGYARWITEKKKEEKKKEEKEEGTASTRRSGTDTAKDETVFGSFQGLTLFQKDVEVDAKSLEFIQQVRMHKGSDLARFHAKCCNSPLGFVYLLPGFPNFTVLAPRFAKADRELLGPVTWVLMAERKYPNRDYPKVKGTSFMDGMIMGTFVPNLLFLYAYGAVTGKADMERLVKPLLAAGETEIADTKMTGVAPL